VYLVVNIILHNQFYIIYQYISNNQITMRNTLCLIFAFFLFHAAAMAQEPANMKGMTERHNFWRAKLGIAPLTWSNELAKYAQNWANELAAKGCELEHSNGQYGENIYWYSATVKNTQQVVDSWASEAKFYDHNRQVCKGSWDKCGHYTQVIWENTTQVGCAKVTCESGAEIWVCAYDPAGNMDGEKAYKKK